MPRNTAASKTAAGPLNTSKDKIITVLTPQAELAAANAEIERLRELLLAQDTPVSNDESLLDAQRLTTVLQALSQRLSGSTEAQVAPKRSAKVADPPLLTDGTDPTFDNWKLQLRDKLEVNADHFPTPRAKMAYVFGRTGGDAQTHLRPQYTKDFTNPFIFKEEMIEYLSSIFKDFFKI